MADAYTGQLLDTLANLDVADDTAFIYTSDHGHHLGQHRMFGINELYEQTVHVPLVVQLPRRLDSTTNTNTAASHVRNELVSHLDIAPTMRELANLPPDDAMPGQSLVAACQGQPLPDRPMFFQFSGQIGLGDRRRGMVTQRYKYIGDPTDIPELYDLQNDPLEMQNLATDPQHRQLLDQLADQCQAWHESQGDNVQSQRLPA